MCPFNPSAEVQMLDLQCTVMDLLKHLDLPTHGAKIILQSFLDPLLRLADRLIASPCSLAESSERLIQNATS